MLPRFDVTVLVVDDDRAVRRVITYVLRRAGYDVFEQESGEDALDFVRGHDGPIDLLITDCALGGMDGAEAAARIRELRPGLPVLRMSGYTPDCAPSNATDAATHFLQKPFLGEELESQVSWILGRRPTLLEAAV